MSRKKKKPKQPPPRQVIPFTPRPSVQGTPTGFTPGAPVRVKAGVHDPDYPELDLSGWTASILEVEEVEDGLNCNLQWTEETRQRIDPAWRARCEEDGLDFDTIWLYSTDLEHDSTRPAAEIILPRPERHLPRPVGLDEQESRIRAALSVPIGAEIPVVSEESLQAYHDYLTARLVFPLPCHEQLEETQREAEPMTLLRIRVLDGDPSFGLIAEIKRGESTDFVPLWTLAVDSPPEARQLIEDYAFWYWSYNPTPHGAERASPFTMGSGNPVWSTLKAATAYGAACGATTGAILATVDDARIGMWIGMGVVGIVGLLAGARFGRIFGVINGVRFGHLYGGIFGALAGVLLGTAIGVMFMGALGTIPGAILGSLIGTLLAKRKWEPIGRSSWAPLGACIGGLVYATWQDRELAFTGALIGAGSGALLVALVVLMLFVTLAMASRASK